VAGWPHFAASRGLASQAHSPGDDNKEFDAGKSVEARLSGRLATWLGRPANTWRVIDLIKSITPTWTPINTPLSVEFKTPYSTCSSPLVKAPI
jgi:hypothetical protein